MSLGTCSNGCATVKDTAESGRSLSLLLYLIWRIWFVHVRVSASVCLRVRATRVRASLTQIK